jgi:hypothetical protein
MDINNIVHSSREEQCKRVLSSLLRGYLTPAFGALPKNEVELLILQALESLDCIPEEPKVYELVSKLRVTRSKARTLLYERELRRFSPEDLDEKVKLILKKPLLQKDAKGFILEVENPLVSDHLRSQVQELGYVSDGSFSPSIVKLGFDAVSALIESNLSDEEIEKVKEALIRAGAPDKSFRGIIKATLRKVASKIAADAGDAAMEQLSDYVAPIFDGAIEGFLEKAEPLFQEAD